MASHAEPFGWELLLDVYGCDSDISDAGVIVDFVIRLCSEVLQMRRFGDPLIARFGESSLTTAGYSVVQLIETSSVVGHFSEARRDAYLDIFSCRAFDVGDVEDFVRETFAPRETRSSFIVRGAPPV